MEGLPSSQIEFRIGEIVTDETVKGTNIYQKPSKR
jgi:hypothetical protein